MSITNATIVNIILSFDLMMPRKTWRGEVIALTSDLEILN